ncbi:MAG: PilZ domain-containing protein [Acidiferrobacterales bacterium]
MDIDTDMDMDMDRRWTARVPVTLHAALYYNGLGIIKCNTLDISLDGALVMTGRVILDQDAPLDIILCGYDKETTVNCRLKANVARVTMHGAGISFQDVSPENYRFLQSEMDSAVNSNDYDGKKVFTQS